MIDAETPDHVFQWMYKHLSPLNNALGQMKDLEYE